jgi:tRNA A-37 threonylcarbamoyl transferase component Bud32
VKLTSGRTLSHYSLIEEIGRGAMGEVYRAKDTKLGREVAIKVLPEHFAQDEERLRRFQREATSLASLNHPNVAQIFGVDREGDVCFLVLELVPGESLEERLKRGPLPIDEAIDVCRQIAEGLEAAHEAGVIHRDLKPANVRLTPDGNVKLLDFGLAKPARDSGDAQSSTDSVLSTEAGRLLGTPTYMAPEQARGKSIDKRVDVWAFGCVLFECLTAKRAFEGETLTDVFAAVIERQPDWAKLPPATPARVRELLERCFAKDPRDRLRDVGEARVLLSSRSAALTATGAAPRARMLALAAVGIASALLGAAAVRFLSSPTSIETVRVRRFEVQGVHSVGFSPIAFSPDGQWLACCSAEGSKRPVLLRRLDGFECRPIADSDGGMSPMFAPDSAAVAFYVQGRGLLRVGLEPGAAVQTITADATPGQGTWGPDGTLVFTGGQRNGTRWPGLMRVRAEGGTPEVLTTVDTAKGERLHHWPRFLPGGEAMLLTVELEDHFRVEALTLATGERHMIVDHGTSASYLPTGHLVYGNFARKELLVAPFDARAVRLTGPAVVAVSGVASLSLGTMGYAVADDGTLAYDPDGHGDADSRLVWFDRSGTRSKLDDEIADWVQPRLSPDGKRLLVRKAASPACSLWAEDLERGVKTRLPIDLDTHEPLWSADGTKIFFDAAGAARAGVFHVPSDGSAPPELLVEAREHKLLAHSLSPDGRFLALTSNEDAATAPDIEILDLQTRKRSSFLKTKSAESSPAFSPDGRTLAYSSNETGDAEIYLRPFPGPGAVVRVSTAGGSFPRWARNGRELFFTKDRKMFAVDIGPSPAVEVGQPVLLFESTAKSPLRDDFDVSLDGQRFVVSASTTEADEMPFVRVVTNWFEEVRKLAPPRGSR